MTIPTSSNFPNSFDSDTNLYHVHDSLRVLLVDNYNPGDTSITVDGDEEVINQFPSSGIITLTDQCDEIETRAISFFYGSKTDFTFDELELIPGFEDVIKPKSFTRVTLNVVDSHHNNIKDALIAIEEFVGVKGTFDTMPLGDTLEGRINFLRKLVFTPRAWYSVVGSRVGLVPLDITFKDESFRLGPGSVIYLWDFGDQSTSVISTSSIISTTSVIYPTICVTSVVPVDQTNVIVQDLDGGTVKKTYSTPGTYDVTLTVSNMYGEDTVLFTDLISARIDAPDEAVIDFIGKANQTVTTGSPVGGPYTTPPTIRSSVETFIDMEITEGKNPSTGKSYGGEPLDSYDNPIDPIDTYTWTLGDDLTHANQQTTRALYSVGGIYDLILRVDTEFGAYRITTYSNAIDIVETNNLWLWTFDGPSHPEGETSILDYLKLAGTTTTHEFGLINETFKTGSSQLTILRDDSFLESPQWEEIDDPSSGYSAIDNAKIEFRRNVAFTPKGSAGSGDQGDCLLYYSTGGTEVSSLTDQIVRTAEYNGFTDTYNLSHSTINRPWNWAFLGGNTQSYFVLGQGLTAVPNTNPSYQEKTTVDLSSMSQSQTSLTLDNYKNGANELVQHTSIYDPTSGLPLNGWFANYRSTWKNNTGYFIRNDGVGAFFRLKSFYKTEGTSVEEFINIKKLSDMDGPTKLEGQLLPLTSGIFFFNNSGNISAYNDTTGIWETGGPSADSIAFHSIQDTSVEGYNSGSNTLLAASDNDYTAYLSYDYSENAFVKFNGQDLTFNVGQTRPTGSQFAMGIY